MKHTIIILSILFSFFLISCNEEVGFYDLKIIYLEGKDIKKEKALDANLHSFLEEMINKNQKNSAFPLFPEITLIDATGKNPDLKLTSKDFINAGPAGDKGNQKLIHREFQKMLGSVQLDKIEDHPIEEKEKYLKTAGTILQENKNLFVFTEGYQYQVQENIQNFTTIDSLILGVNSGFIAGGTTDINILFNPRNINPIDPKVPMGIEKIVSILNQKETDRSQYLAIEKELASLIVNEPHNPKLWYERARNSVALKKYHTAKEHLKNVARITLANDQSDKYFQLLKLEENQYFKPIKRKYSRSFEAILRGLGQKDPALLDVEMNVLRKDINGHFVCMEPNSTYMNSHLKYRLTTGTKQKNGNTQVKVSIPISDREWFDKELTLALGESYRTTVSAYIDSNSYYDWSVSITNESPNDENYIQLRIGIKRTKKNN